jgi:hypothetical protein
VSGPGEDQGERAAPAVPDPPAWPAPAGSLVGSQLRIPGWMRDWTLAMRAAQAPG